MAETIFGLDSAAVRDQGYLQPMCPKCHALIPEDVINKVELTPCTQCRSALQVEVFPAFFRRAVFEGSGDIALVDGEATCFYHSSKKAVLPCHGCGRFLCALCDCDLNGEHFCPSCLETGKSKGRIKNLERHRTLYDTIALHLAVLPLAVLIFWFATFITAPMALFIAIRYWNAPRSIIPRTKIRYIVAIVIATLEIVAWAIGIYALSGGFSA